MNFTNANLIGLIAGASFASGLNVYATVATLGLLARAGVLTLPAQLHPVASWTVIVISVVMFGIEFFADKIPAFDLVWNSLQTFVRVPVAALLAYGASAQLTPELRLLAAALGGAIALASHGGKLAARTAVTPSPEPVSNILLSLGEDAGAITLTWAAERHPIWTTVIVLALLVILFLFVRKIVRGLRRLFRSRSPQPAAV